VPLGDVFGAPPSPGSENDTQVPPLPEVPPPPPTFDPFEN